MTEPAPADMIEPNFDDQIRPQGLPFAGALGAPPAGPARGIAGKARRLDNPFELPGQRPAFRATGAKVEALQGPTVGITEDTRSRLGVADGARIWLSYG